MVIWVTISQVVTVYAEAQRDEDTQAAAGQGLCGGAPPVLPPFGSAPWTPEHEFSLMSLCEFSSSLLLSPLPVWPPKRPPRQCPLPCFSTLAPFSLEKPWTSWVATPRSCSENRGKCWG